GVPAGVWALLLSYDGMTPPEPAGYAVLADWVSAGHALLCFRRGNDPYALVPAWWNGNVGDTGPWADLFRRLGLAANPAPGLYRVGSGVVLIELEGPIALARRKGGAAIVQRMLRAACEAMGPAAP